MANFGVTWDASAFGRLDAAEATTNFTAEGISSLSQEPDWHYQGTYCISGLVKTSEVGFYCAPGSTAMNGTPNRVWLCKLNQTNKDAIDGNGILVRIGSGTGAYYEYAIFSATTYPIAGGWQLVVIDPNVSQWRGSTTGSPNLGAVNYFALRSDCNATAKTQNLGMDAVDVMDVGTGLTGVGADTTGTFDNFRAYDEDTSTNRWGIVQSRGGILYVSGVLTIGSSGTPADFDDMNAVLVFPDHRVTTGFCGLDLDIQNASTTIALANCVFNGRGALYTSDDTRPDYTVTGTSGTLSVLGSTFNVFRQIDFTSACVVNDCAFLNGLLVNSGEADLQGSIFEGCTGAAGSSYLTWDNSDPDGYLDNCSFTKGSTATHAIEFGASIPASITLTGIDFSGYNASDSQNDSTLYFADTGGTITLNLVGCSGTISIDTAGCTVNKVIDPVTTTLTVIDATTKAVIQNARVFAVAADATGDLPFELSISSITRSGSTATVTTGSAHNLTTGDVALIAGVTNGDEYNGAFTVTVTDSTHFTYTVPGTPTSPATGTIIVTGGYFNELTNASGIVTDTRSITNDQPLTGWVRKGSSSPYYRTSGLDFTVDSANGYTANVPLIADE